MSIAPAADRDPYLPPPVPTDNPPEKPKSNAKKTLVLWCVLLVMFVGLYQLFAEGPSSRHAPVESCSSGFSGWSFVMPGLCVAFLVWFFLQLRTSRGFNQAINAATLALADGDVERGRQIFAELVEKNRRSQHVSTARVNLAWALQRLGRFDEEREVLLAVERTPGLLYASEHRVYAATYLARHFALAGDLERAQAWLADAQQRRSRVGELGLFVVAQLRVTEAIVLARLERYAEALVILEKDWPRIEASFTGLVMKHVVVLRGFLVSSAGGVRDEGLAAQWVARLRPFRTDEIAYLWQAWPALRQWAEANQLVREPARAQAS